ncbi:ABC transporter permease subunit [Paracoccus limosus]|uniref:ABC transporter permease subunit n=1 Tax=Paracoccus limosus TaxID=913252 RepID=A0A844H4P3_9RHOB|nr:ABC transporter permease [Paracoccus limosus]MTH35959.1 ABC transporter permease subunit [Paracoccus limosus]
MSLMRLDPARGRIAGFALPRLPRFRALRNWRVSLGGAILLVVLVSSLLAPWISPFDPYAQDLKAALLPPGGSHLLGTDEFGRDLLSRLIWGGRIALLVAAVSVVVSLIAGLFLGLVAGYFGGWLDALIMRGVDILLAFPNFLLAIAMVAILGPGLANMLVAIAIFGIPGFVRLYRAEVLTLKGADYVEAARSMGAGPWQVIRRHILPNSIPLVIVLCSLRAATAILVASGLSFLGLGVEPPLPDWGAMLTNGREYLRVAPHLTTVPGLAIMALVFAFNIFGDGLRDILDPRRKH